MSNNIKAVATTEYNDYLTLIRIDGNWQVIAKVYHQFEG